MKNNKIISKTLISLISLVMIFSGCVTLGNINTVYAASDPSVAPEDWAFEESSIPLHDAILEKYPTVDKNDDGYISIDEANAKTQRIELKDLSLPNSTLNGITHFTQIDYLYIRNCEIKGVIPPNIDDMVGLRTLYLSINNLEGEIPESITNMTNLIQFSVASNQLEGTIPEKIGQLTKVVALDFNRNLMSGEIPQSVATLERLKRINFADNNFTGTIPEEFYGLPALERFIIQNNSELQGNLAEGFASSTTLNYLDVSGTNAIQAQPNIPTLVNGGTFTYDNLAENLLTSDKTGLADSVTQADIDKAQESADYWSEPVKSKWQANIDLAQSMLDAKEAVENLFDTNEDIKDTATQTDINNAQDLVNVLPDGALKDELQTELDKAQELLDNRNDAKEKVEDLFNPDGSIKDTVNQGNIDEAQKAVNKLPEGALKNELQDKIDEAQKQLDKKNNAKEKVEDLFNPDGSIKDTVNQGNIDEAQKAVNKLPEGALKNELQNKIDEAQKQLNKPVISKPSTGKGSTTNRVPVATSDAINVTAHISLLISSLAAISFATKRKPEKV